MRTPAPETAAGRRGLAAKDQALPDGTDPIPNLDYLKKAIRSKGRVDPSKWPALAALIRKRARELGALNAAGVKGTWAFEGSNGYDPALELVGPKGYEHGWIKVGPGGESPKVGDHLKAAARAINEGRHADAVNHLTAAHNAAHGKDAKEKIAAARGKVAGEVMSGRRTAKAKAPAVRSAGPDLSTPEGRRRAVENADTSIPAGRALVRKAMREAEKSAPVTRLHMTADETTTTVELAMTRMIPKIQGVADVQAARTGPGKITVMHKATGMKVGTVTKTATGWAGQHASGTSTTPAGSMGGAMAGLVAWHNAHRAGQPLQATGSGPQSYASDAPAVELALPITTPAVTSGDGPRVTKMAGSPAAGQDPEVQKIYKKLMARGMKPAAAMAMAKRAAAMHVRAQAKDA